MKSQLDRLEARLQVFIENSLTSLIPWGHSHQSLARQLVESMQSNSTETGEGFQAPNIYTILVNPSRLPSWQANPSAVDDLGKVLEEAGEEAGIRFAAKPIIRVAIDAALPVQEVRVVTSSDPVELSDTASLDATAVENPDAPSEEIKQNAFFIVNGLKIYQIHRSVTNIGRRQDNHLIVDDPRVSRTHAQLRYSKGNFVLFDLNSSGGTYVNSQRINRYVLKPGDVVSLAGIPLVFGLDAISDANDPNEERKTLESGYTSQFPVNDDEPSKDPE